MLSLNGLLPPESTLTNGSVVSTGMMLPATPASGSGVSVPLRIRDRVVMKTEFSPPGRLQAMYAFPFESNATDGLPDAVAQAGRARELLAKEAPPLRVAETPHLMVSCSYTATTCDGSVGSTAMSGELFENVVSSWLTRMS